MARQVLDETAVDQIYVGAVVGDGTGTPGRTSFQYLKNWAAKLNSMTSEIYSGQTITEVVGTSALTLVGATQTASTPVINATQTWNNAGVAFAGIKLNVTNTASAAASKLLDIQVGGASTLSVSVAGAMTLAAPTAGDALTLTSLAGAAGLKVNAAYGTGAAISVAVGTGTGTDQAVFNATGNSSGKLNSWITNTGAGSVDQRNICGTVGTQWFVTTSLAKIGTYSAHAFSLQANGLTALTIGTTGGVTINAPTSGIPLTVNGGSSYSLFIVPPAGAFTPVNISNGTSTLLTSTDASNNFTFGTSTAHNLTFYSSNSARMQIGSGGNVTINAPASGIPLDVTPLAATPGISISAASGVVARMRLNQATVSVWFIDNVATTGSFQITNTTVTPFSATTSGSVTIGAPTSGVALTVNQFGTQPAISVTGGTNPYMRATDGTTTGKLQVITGAGVYVGSESADSVALMSNNTARITANSNGNVAVNPPASGTALAVTAVAGGLAAIFSAGPIKRASTTVASLMAAATAGAGAEMYVTDALAPTFGATVAGGGSVFTPVYSDGTNWKVG